MAVSPRKKIYSELWCPLAGARGTSQGARGSQNCRGALHIFLWREPYRPMVVLQSSCMLYTWQCHFCCSGQRILEDFEKHVADAEAERDKVREYLEKASKILTDVKIGVEHLAHKLQHLKAVRTNRTSCLVFHTCITISQTCCFDLVEIHIFYWNSA